MKIVLGGSSGAKKVEKGRFKKGIEDRVGKIWDAVTVLQKFDS